MDSEGTSPAQRLRQLQPGITEANLPPTDDATEKLYVAEVSGRLHVEFYGSPFGTFVADLLSLLREPDIAASLRSLTFRGSDEGDNGTRNWDFTPLLNSEVAFPNLITLFIEPTAPEHHNHSILAVDYDEDGQLARFLTAAPALRSLTAPSAPDHRFFEVGPHPLINLRIATGYDHQNFIRNLSQSACFPELRVLDFTDYEERYADNYPAACTPFEDYQRLFTSPLTKGIQRFILRNPVLSQEQLARLRTLRPNMPFSVIYCNGHYIR
jgi:hypothetical protein